MKVETRKLIIDFILQEAMAGSREKRTLSQLESAAGQSQYPKMICTDRNEYDEGKIQLPCKHQSKVKPKKQNNRISAQ